jgi:dTDP-4-amino-4,6-dideoxygalactose transaminase
MAYLLQSTNKSNRLIREYYCNLIFERRWQLRIIKNLSLDSAHLMPYYREQGWREGDLMNEEEYYKGCISLPMYPTLNNRDIDSVIQVIKKFFNI